MNFEEIMKKYALPILCMALIVMVLVGIIKIFTKMVANKKHQEEATVSKVMSYLYVVFALVFTAGTVFGYHYFFKLGFDTMEMIKEGLSVFGCSQALYPIYRDYGGRFLFLKVLSLFKGKSTKTDEIISVIEKVMPLTDRQKNAISEKLHDEI